MKTDTKTLVSELRRYNKWRRGDEVISQMEPAVLGKIIDNAADRLEELERELAAERAQIEANHKVTRIIEEMLYAERALADRLAFALTDSATWDHALPAYEAWKEARRE
jgi:hypothetical protein